jgi:uncharacterized YccA/Bax inhibitor family protein
MATANPAMDEGVYNRALSYDRTPASTMTMTGSVVKTSLLVAILLATGGYTWTLAAGESGLSTGLLVAGSLGGLVVAFITIWFPKASPITAPIYAALEGIVLGAISSFFESRFPGIVFQAVGLSIGTLTMMLILYGTGIIRVTQKFMIGVVAATGAVALVYLVDIVASLFGTRLPYIHESGLVGIGFSLVVVAIAALNLILDFDFIYQGVQRRAPKYMEWYGGFSLLVTLVWMYLEILRLLAKLRSRD